MKRSVSDFRSVGCYIQHLRHTTEAIVTQFSRRHFITSAAAVASSAMLSKIAIAAPQDPVIDAKPDPKLGGKPINREKVSWKALPFPLTQVRLGNGLCTVAMEADRQYLRSLPPDR